MLSPQKLYFFSFSNLSSILETLIQIYKSFELTRNFCIIFEVFLGFVMFRFPDKS